MQFRRRNRHGHRQPSANDEFGVSLVTLKEGDQAIMTHTTGDLNVVRRLSEMGLTPGSELKVRRKCSFRGPLEIEVRGVALALGYALASEICVQPLEGKTQ
jgi:Fe2+ transport system protein FeoA